MRHGRLPWPLPAELDPDGTAVYEAITGGPRASGTPLFRIRNEDGRLEGPFNAMLVGPTVGFALQELGAAIRYRTGLTDRAREVAILTLAAHRQSGYEAYAHEAVGRAVGLTDAELVSLRSGAVPATLSEDEQVVHRCCTSMLTERTLSDTDYRAAVEALGERGLIELTTLVGYYDTLDLLMSVAQSPMPSGVASPFESSGGQQ